MAKGDPNIVGKQLFTVPAEAAFETTPTVAELSLFAVPDNANFKCNLRSVSVVFHVVPADGTNNVHGDLEWVDDSAADAVTDLVTDYDFETATARVGNLIWAGNQPLDPGDSVNVEFDITTPDTAGAGAAFIVEVDIVEYAGS